MLSSPCQLTLLRDAYCTCQTMTQHDTQRPRRGFLTDTRKMAIISAHTVQTLMTTALATSTTSSTHNTVAAPLYGVQLELAHENPLLHIAKKTFVHDHNRRSNLRSFCWPPFSISQRTTLINPHWTTYPAYNALLHIAKPGCCPHSRYAPLWDEPPPSEPSKLQS